MINRFWLLILLTFNLLGFNSTLKAQLPDSIGALKIIKNDTLKPVFKKAKPSKHSPLKASVLSAILPGAGQAYNKKWWKVPLVAGLVGGCGYLTIDQFSQYQRYREAYAAVADSDPATVDNVFNGKYSAAQLKSLRDGTHTNFELLLLGTLVLHSLNILDAFVDAHLIEFDVSEDIGLKIKPQINSIQWAGESSNMQLGVGLAFRFK